MKKFFARAKKGIMQEVSVVCYLFAVTFVFLMQSPLNIWIYNGNPGVDPSVFRTVSLYMQNGLMPYRDIFDHKGPLIYIYNWLGMEIKYWRGIWVIEFISLFLCVILFYKIARLVCGKLHSCLVILIVMASLYAYFEDGNLVEEYALPFIAGSLYIFTDYFLNEKISRFRLAMCGFSFAAVCLLRINMVSVWVVFCMAVLVRCIMKKTIKDVISFLLWFLGGAAVITIPILMWLAVNGAFGDFIYDYFVFNNSYINEIEQGQNLLTLMRYFSFSYFLNTPYMLISSIVAIYLGRRKRDLFHVAYVLSIFATLLFICLGGRIYNHYGMILVPLMVYPVAHLFSQTKGNEKLVFGGIAMYMLAILALPLWITSGLNRTMNCYYDRENTLVRTDVVGEITRFIAENSDENDKITVWGNWNIIYTVTKRLSASKYTYQFPIGEVDASIMDAYFKELQESMPKMIVIEQYKELGEMESFIHANNYSLVKEADEARIYMISSPDF